jgi:two-component system LytT family response regulator
MTKVLIIEDEPHAINTIVNHLKPYKDYDICGIAKTVEEAIELTKKSQPNLVFLDIVLGSKTGFDYLNTIKPDINFDIIFTTAYNDYAEEAFEYSALHYLLKPINSDSIHNALIRVKEKIAQQERLERLNSLEHNLNHPDGYKLIHLSASDGCFKIESKNILFIKSDSNYSHFYLAGKRKITISKTLKYYSEILKNSHFYRVHKSYLVNTEQMHSYDKKHGILTMNDNTDIPVAHRKRTAFYTIYFSTQ